MSLFIPTYFSPIAQYAQIIKYNRILFEVEDNFQKQTYRNRCYIYGANGKQLLTIPIKHKASEKRKKTKDTRIENNFPWQKQHLKSLQSAYRSSPFFEFYEADLAPIFTKKFTFLLDLNIATFIFLTEALQLSLNYEETTSYSLQPLEEDYRHLAIAKKNVTIKIPNYTQIFATKHGFIGNLSILDLLFMEGPNSSNFLQNVTF